MYTPEELARKLNSALKNSGYSTYYLESRKKPFRQQSESVEVLLGIPNVFPPSADGDALIQITDTVAKLTTDIIRVPQSKAADIVIMCNGINAQVIGTRFYVQPSELVVVADHDFMYTNDSFIDQIISYLPMYKHDVSQAHMFIQRELAQ